MGSPQFHISLSSTNQFHTKGPLSSTSPLSSTPETPQFHKKTSQFNTLLRKKLCWTEGFLVWNWGVCGTEGFLMWRRGSFGVELRGFYCGNEGCVELRGFWCGTEGVLVLNWGFLIRNWGIWVFNCGVLMLNWGTLSTEQVWSFCGTDVLNWGVLDFSLIHDSILLFVRPNF